MSTPRQPDDLTTAEKIGAGVTSGVGLIACGPCVFLLIFLLLTLAIGLPFSFLIGWNTAMMAILGVIAGIITVIAVTGIVINKLKEDKRKDYVKKAEFERAKKMLRGD